MFLSFEFGKNLKMHTYPLNLKIVYILCEQYLHVAYINESVHDIFLSEQTNKSLKLIISHN